MNAVLKPARSWLKPPDLPLLLLTLSLGGEWFWLPEVSWYPSKQREGHEGRRLGLGWLYVEVEVIVLFPSVWQESHEPDSTLP